MNKLVPAFIFLERKTFFAFLKAHVDSNYIFIYATGK